MNVILKNRYRVEIVLDSGELEELDICYDDLDYASADTRRVLWLLLGKARERLGIRPDPSGKLLIEAMKEKDGCRLCFTFLPPEQTGGVPARQLIKTDERPLACECASAEEAVLTAVKSGFAGRTSLYERGGKFALLFYADAETKQRLLFRLADFADVSGNLTERECARYAEFWNLIESDRAAELLETLR